jgi:NADH:ubiquinone oxidoreductase subunit K
VSSVCVWYTGNNTDANKYKRRSTLSTIEKEQLEDMDRDPVVQIFKGLSRTCDQPLDQVKEWPFYFENKEAAGHAIQKGYLNLWSTFIIAETLLAGIAIQPFVSNTPNMSGWQLEVYGGLWTLALLLDFLALGITALFLGYLLGNPSHVAWVCVCKIGPLIGIPAMLVLLATIWSLIAISFSSWVIYGTRVGIICVVVAVFDVAAGVAIFKSFLKASKEIEALP